MSDHPYQQNSWQSPPYGYPSQTQTPYFPPPPGSDGIPPPPPPGYSSQPVSQPVSQPARQPASQTGAPPLPPRPAVGASRLTVRSNLNFPPPPPSPNRPPALPPRPQSKYQPTYSQHSQHSQYSQPSYQPPAGGPPQYAPPVYSPPPYTAPATVPTAVPQPQYGYVPPPVQTSQQPPAQTNEKQPVQTYTAPEPPSSTWIPPPPPPPLTAPPSHTPVVAEPVNPTQPDPVEYLGTQFQSVQLSSPETHSSAPISHVPPPYVPTEREQPAPTPVAEPVSPPPPSAEILPQKNPFRHEPSGLRTVRKCVENDKGLSGLTTWYAHASAPFFPICSRCYADHVWPTVFRSAFSSLPAAEEVGQETRRCFFSSLRIQELLFPPAAASGNLQPVFDFVRRRQSLPACKGIAGADGQQGIRWFRPRDNAVPHMVVCEACWEDTVLAKPTMAAHFEPATGQQPSDTWACDFALISVARAYKECSKTNDWSGFVAAARTRLSLATCGRGQACSTQRTGWHTPVQGPFDVILCDACYDDYVVPEQHNRWTRNDPRGVAGNPQQFTCFMGDYKCLILLASAVESKDWTRFWRGVERQAKFPACAAEGTQGTSWYRFASQPDEFGICGTCYSCVIEPLELAAWFVPRQPAIAPDTALLCSLHENTRRVQAYRRFVADGWLTGDCAAWEQYTIDLGTVKPCSRDQDIKDGVWYGWPACTICRECYVEFVRGTALDTPEAMPLRGVKQANSTICQMYSPRMRALYKEACARRPADPAELLVVAEKRAAVYWNTIPICRQMLQQARMQADQARFMGMMGSFYKNMGGMQAAVMPSAYRYSHTGLGYGFDNVWQIEGARWDQEASATASMVGGSPAIVVGQLEKRWRAVE